MKITFDFNKYGTRWTCSRCGRSLSYNSRTCGCGGGYGI